MDKSRRDTILDADDLGEELYPVPEWNIDILFYGMDGLQRDKVQKVATSDDPKKNAAILLMLARDPDTREPMFDKADLDALTKKNGAVVERAAIFAIQMGGTDDAEAEVAEDPISVGN